MRTFLAITLPNKDRQKIYEFINSVKIDFGDEIKWVNPTLLHVTLKFLGEFDQNDLINYKNCLIQSLYPFSKFILYIRGFGVFPNPVKPKVIWLGLQYPKELPIISHRIEECSEKLGYSSEKRGFSPHLTIGRVKNDLTSDQKLLIQRKIESLSEFPFSNFPVQRLSFFKSDLTRQGPIHTKLFDIILKN